MHPVPLIQEAGRDTEPAIGVGAASGCGFHSIILPLISDKKLGLSVHREYPGFL